MLHFSKIGTNITVFVTFLFVRQGNFVPSNKRFMMMEKLIDIPRDLYEDEAVLFIAGRYSVTPQRLLEQFLVQNGDCATAEPQAFRLEDNEMEILRGLAGYSH